jgi:D-psicose/D-tagatose/L-ribulose 3-epimerase
MNKIGIYYAYWTTDWDADFHPYIDKVADLGFDILEINAGTFAELTSAQRQGLKSHADEKGITLTFCIGLPPQYDIASEEQSRREAGVKYLQQLAKAIGEVGGGQLGGILYSCWPATPPEKLDKVAYFERSVESMKRAVRTAEDAQVFFNLEVVNRFEQFLLNTCDEAIQYIEAVGSPNVRIMLDTFHMNIEENFLGEAILKAGSRLGHFHIGENNRMPPGYGHIPWTEVANALRQINYQGYVVMEPFILPGGQVGRDIKVFRALGYGLDLDEEARKALWFIRGVLK